MKYFLYIGVGFLNVIHASLHLIQFVQSIVLLGYSTENSYVEELLHNKFVSFIIGILGLATLIIGIKDFMHHRKENNELLKQISNK